MNIEEGTKKIILGPIVIALSMMLKIIIGNNPLSVFGVILGCVSVVFGATQVSIGVGYHERYSNKYESYTISFKILKMKRSGKYKEVTMSLDVRKLLKGKCSDKKIDKVMQKIENKISKPLKRLYWDYYYWTNPERRDNVYYPCTAYIKTIYGDVKRGLEGINDDYYADEFIKQISVIERLISDIENFIKSEIRTIDKKLREELEDERRIEVAERELTEKETKKISFFENSEQIRKLI